MGCEHALNYFEDMSLHAARGGEHVILELRCSPCPYTPRGVAGKRGTNVNASNARMKMRATLACNIRLNAIEDRRKAIRQVRAAGRQVEEDAPRAIA